MAGLLALGGAPALATETGFVVVAGGSLNQADATVIMLDLSSLRRTGDEVTANMTMVVVQPELGQLPAMSYMVEQERMSCRARTRQTMRLEAYADGGTKLTEVNEAYPAQTVQPNSTLAEILDRACSGGQFLAGGAAPFQTVEHGVAAVRAGVNASRAARSEQGPHRYVPLGGLNPQDGAASHVYLDRAQLERDGTAPVRWLLMVHTPPRMARQPSQGGAGVPVAYDMLQFAFDCQGQRSRLRVGMSFSAANQLVISSVELGPWAAVGGEGSPDRRHLEAACTAEPPETEASFETVQAAVAHARSLTPAAAAAVAAPARDGRMWRATE